MLLCMQIPVTFSVTVRKEREEWALSLSSITEVLLQSGYNPKINKI